MRGEKKDIKKKNQMGFLEMKNISEVKNTLDDINSRFFTAEERSVNFQAWKPFKMNIREHPASTYGVESFRESRFHSSQ